MTHTPGPWTTGSDKKGDEYAFCIVQNKSWRGQQFIARVEPYGVYEGLDEAEANARLIAAAPTLLEAVLQYRNDMLHPNIADDSRARRLEMIEAVIAQAKGETK